MTRIFDIIFSVVALIVLSPLLITTALILKFTGEKEILFVQDRIGKSGKLFKLLKFVTMLKNSPNIGTRTITMKDDYRILPVGRFLRRSKINELPQLLNVLSGEMSLIGPRPLTEETFNFYCSSTQNIISQVQPGLSGIGSLIFRNEEEIINVGLDIADLHENVIATYKGQLELWFVHNKNIYLYFIIIILTFWIVLFPKSQLVWCVLRDLPTPPDDLKLVLGYKQC